MRTRYRLEAGSGPGPSDIASIEISGAVTIFQGNAPAGVYYVRVRAGNNAGVSASSNEVVVNVGGCAGLGNPFGLVANVIGNQVQLSWSAPAGDLSILTGYRLQARVFP